jgi:hypothetical protein
MYESVIVVKRAGSAKSRRLAIAAISMGNLPFSSKERYDEPRNRLPKPETRGASHKPGRGRISVSPVGPFATGEYPFGPSSPRRMLSPVDLHQLAFEVPAL